MALLPKRCLRDVLQREMPDTKIDEITLSFLTDAMGDDTPDAVIIEAWNPFWINFGVANDDDIAGQVSLKILTQMRSDEATPKACARTDSSGNQSSTSAASGLSTLQETPVREKTVSPPIPAETTTYGEVVGLDSWLAELRLQMYKEKALDWCDHMGACDVDEIRQNWEEFSDELQLKPLQRTRLKKDVEKNTQTSSPEKPLQKQAVPSDGYGTSCSSTAPVAGTTLNFGSLPTRAPEGPKVKFGRPGENQYVYSTEIGSGAQARVYRCFRLDETNKPITCSFVEIDLVECSLMNGEVITRVKIPAEATAAWPSFIGQHLKRQGHGQKGIIKLLNSNGEILWKDDAEADCKECLDEEYAVKIIRQNRPKLVCHNQAEHERKVKERMHREITILFALQHDHIVRLYDVFEEPEKKSINSSGEAHIEPEKLYLVMELVEGGDLMDHIRERHAEVGMPEHEAKYVFIQLVDALQYIHSKGVIHRDLKPENILINKKASKPGFLDVKVSDFGHSKLLDDGSFAETKCGTPMFCAPEVNSGTGYDWRVDLWSLGGVLYVMLEGRYPFDGSNDAIHRQIRQAAFSFEDRSASNSNDDARKLICRLMTVTPTDRISLEECKKHPWVAGRGGLLRVINTVYPVSNEDEERIPLPRRPTDHESLRSDLQQFTTKTRIAATLHNKEEVRVIWRCTAPSGTLAPAEQLQEVRQKLEGLLRQHFKGFSLPARGAAASTTGRPLRKSAGGDDKSFRIVQPYSLIVHHILQVAEDGTGHPTAGLDLFPTPKGMRVDGVEAFPGQHGNILIGDLIVNIDQVPLASQTAEETVNIFGQHFCDGASITIKRNSNQT